LRFGFLFTEVFWGIFLIIIGLSVVIKVLFNINIPLLRLALAFLLIYLGISMLVGGQGIKARPNTVLFNEMHLKASEAGQYNIIFGKGTLDLSALTAGGAKTELNTIFGAGVIEVNPKIPVRLHVNAAFAGATMPDGNTISFGDYLYQSPEYREGQPFLEIEANVVFGALTIQQQ
jgi:hypothetical protein